MPSSSHLKHFFERGPFEINRALFLFEPFEPAFGLVEIGKHQFALHAFDGGYHRRRAAGEVGNHDQQRLEVANHRQQTGVERGALFLFLGIGREIEHGQLDRDFLLRSVSRFEKVEALVGDLDLAEAPARPWRPPVQGEGQARSGHETQSICRRRARL